jgi:hypothetical protein
MIWNTRTAAHSILRFMKRVKFFLYGYTNVVEQSKQIFSRDTQEVHSRIPSIAIFILLCYVVIGIRLIQIYASATKATILRADITVDPTSFAVIVLLFGSAVSVLILYFLGKLPLYVARALMWVARGNHERRIGFAGLGILMLGFLFQAAVNLM